MISNSNVLPGLVIITVFGGITWFRLDMSAMLRLLKRKNALSIEGKWKELDEHFRRTERTLRPFVRLHHRYLMPGNLETQYALFLYKQGRLEEALARIDLAIRRNKSKPAIFRKYYAKGTFVTLRGALRTRMLILNSLGRYDDSWTVAAELDRLTAPRHQPNGALALLNLYNGRFREAIAEGQGAAAEDSDFDSLCTVAALAYCYQGEFQKAFEALSYEPADAFKFYSKAGLAQLTQIPEGVELIALKRKKLAGVFPPLRLVAVAQVHLAMENFAKVEETLDEAAKLMGPEPGLQFSYARVRAISFAGQGKNKEAEEYIERMRTIVREVPKRATRWEMHYSVGRAYFYLGRHNDALAALNEALRSVLHPVEKHVNAFWLAQTHEALGHGNDAGSFYQQVLDDGIPSRVREQAAAALARVQG